MYREYVVKQQVRHDGTRYAEGDILRSNDYENIKHLLQQGIIVERQIGETEHRKRIAKLKKENEELKKQLEAIIAKKNKKDTVQVSVVG